MLQLYLGGKHALSQGYPLLLAFGLLCPEGLEVACGLSLREAGALL